VLQIEETVRRVNLEKGVTVVIATHNLLQAKRLSHRVAFLWMGELVEVGETREVFENPRSERTALYLSGKVVY
jgi:tungstate transport system ATP-binding protein